MYFIINVLPGPANADNGVRGTKKLLLKTQVDEDFVYWSESNNITSINIKFIFISNVLLVQYTSCYMKLCSTSTDILDKSRITHCMMGLLWYDMFTYQFSNVSLTAMKQIYNRIVLLSYYVIMCSEYCFSFDMIQCNHFRINIDHFYRHLSSLYGGLAMNNSVLFAEESMYVDSHNISQLTNSKKNKRYKKVK